MARPRTLDLVDQQHLIGIATCQPIRRLDIQPIDRSSPRSGPATVPLSANVRETPTPWKFSVEGETGFADVHDHGGCPDGGGDRGGGEGGAAGLRPVAASVAQWVFLSALAYALARWLCGGA